MRVALGVWLLACFAGVAAEDSVCERLFDQETLVCSTCDLIEREHPELTSLASDCKKCCGKNEQSVLYKSATLQLDPRQKHWYPDLGAFIDDHANEFKERLTVKYASQSRPVLVMTKEGGGTDRVTVASWKTEQILQYLKAKLVA